MSFHADFTVLFSLGVGAWLVGQIAMVVCWILAMALRRVLSNTKLVSNVD